MLEHAILLRSGSKDRGITVPDIRDTRLYWDASIGPPACLQHGSGIASSDWLAYLGWRQRYSSWSAG